MEGHGLPSQLSERREAGMAPVGPQPGLRVCSSTWHRTGAPGLGAVKGETSGVARPQVRTGGVAATQHPGPGRPAWALRGLGAGQIQARTAPSQSSKEWCWAVGGAGRP